MDRHKGDSTSKKVKKLIELFYKLRSTPLKKDKLRLISKFAFQKTLKRIFSLVYDYTFPIYFSRIEITKTTKELKNADKRLAAILTILENLASKTTTKTKAQDLLDTLFQTRITRDENELYNRILQKDLLLGVDEVDIKKMYPNVVKYPVQFMFPGVCNSTLDLKFPVLVEPLISGERIKLVAYPDGRVNAFNLNLTDYRKIFDDLFKVLSKYATKKNKTLEVDTIVFYESFDKTRRLLQSTKNTIFTGKSAVKEIRSLATVFVFDLIIHGKEDLPLKSRKKIAAEFVSKCKRSRPKVVLMPHTLVSKIDQLEKLFNSALKKGYEGLVLKNIKSPYVYKKDNYWLTYKNQEIVSGRILEVIKVPNQETCSALIVKIDDGKTITVTSIRESQREFLWNKRNEIIGMKCDLKIISSSWNPVQKTTEFTRLRLEKGKWR